MCFIATTIFEAKETLFLISNGNCLWLKDRFMTKKLGVAILIAFLSLSILTVNGADRYWVGTTNNNWNDTGNWSTTSGGASGASVPGSGDRALFNSSGNINCTLDIAPTVESIDISVGYSATIDLNGNNLTINGATTNDFEDGTFNNTSGGSISLTCTGTTYFRGSTFNPAVTASSGRLYLNGSRFNGTATMTKTGANSDAGLGGNVFVSGLTMNNSGSGYFMLGNGTQDTITGNLIMNNTGSHNMYLAYNSSGSYVSGDLTINNNGASGSNYIYVADVVGSGITIAGNVAINNIGAGTNTRVYFADDGTANVTGTTTITNNATGANAYVYVGTNTNSSATLTGNVTITNSSTGTTVSSVYLGNNGTVVCSGQLTATNSSTATTHQIVVGNGASSSVTIANATSLTNSGSGTTGRSYLGNYGDVTFNGTLTIDNSDASTNSIVYCNYQSGSANVYNQNITLTNTNAASDGIYFGSNGGSSTLASGRTIAIGGGGFSAGNLYFRNFTQSGNTAQSCTITGTGYIYNYDSDWGGNVTFTAPRYITRGTRYRGTASITKNGATDDQSAGGNVFDGNTTLNCSGADYLMMGNGTPDTFNLDLTLSNTGQNGIYIGYNSAGNYVGGNITATNSGTGTSTWIYLSDATASTLHVEGNVDMTVNGTSTTCVGRIGNTGDVTIDGNLTFTKSSSSTTTDCYIANATNSTVIVGGDLTYSQSGAGTNGRGYLGNNGDLTVGGTLSITNASSATNSQVYCNHTSNSVGTYNGNIVLVSSNASSDGVYFGNGGGSATLAATRTITVGGGGFIAGSIYLRNFTQTGATAQTLTNTGTGYIYNYDSDWGGDVVFSSGRINTRGTRYRGTATLTKDDVSDDQCVGGNQFDGNTTLNCSGGGYLMMGNGSSDAFGANLTLNNSGTRGIYLAYNSAGNTVGGDLTATNSGTGSSTWIYLSDQTASTLQVTGNVSITVSGTSTTCVARLGNTGDVTINGNLTWTRTSSVTTSDCYIANSAASAVSIGGDLTYTQSGAGTNGRMWVGNYGDVTVTGTMTLTNSSTANNSQIYCNYRTGSVGAYNGNIVLNSTIAGSDGVFFGSDGGSGTLAATRTVTVGGGGFSSGDIYFRNFTQVGATAQTLTNTGTGYIYNYDSNWGGDVTFSSGRMYTRGTTYQGTTTLSKTGASDDASAGGNTFTGNATLNNSGSGYFGMGNGSSDSFGANLNMNNSGTYRMYLGQASAGNTVTGDLTVNNSASGSTNTYVYISNNSSTTLSIGGNAVLNNTGSSPDCRIYFGSEGDITLTGNITATNSASGAAGYIQVANSTSSAVSIGGTSSFTNSGSGTTKRIYLGNSGDVTFTGQLTISNSATATNSQVYCNDASNSVNAYNGNIIVESTSASCDGIRFGNNQGSGTLAATRTITVGGGGFIGGDLYFRNFTQVGATAQTLTNTGTGYIYNYDSDWGGNVTFSSGRMYTRGTTYQGTASLTKTGASDDASAGGNSFSGDVTLTNSGSRYFGMGSGTADTYGANVTMNNSGTYNMYLAQGSAGNTIAGTLTVNNNGSGTTNTTYISNSSTSSLTVTGVSTFTNTSTATTSYIYVGEQGDITFNNNVTLTNSGTGTSGYIRLANNTASTVSITGNLTATNSGSGTNRNLWVGNSGDVTVSGTFDATNSASSTNGYLYVASGSASTVSIGGNATSSNSGASTTKRTYLGYYGDVTFSGTLDITNSSSATNSEVYLNDRSGSVGVYSGDITVESTHASCDGIRFGQNGGSGTLAATRTITVGGGGFVAGYLYFRNFTQTGATAQALTLTGTGFIYNYDSQWGGNVTFSSPRYITRGTTYSGTSSISKTGATDDASAGGNTFTGACTLINSGSGYLLMGNGTADTWSNNLTMTNTGTDHMYIAHNSAGNSITGNLISTNNGTGSVIHYFSTNTASTLSIGGDATLNNSGSGSSIQTVFGSSGDITLTGNLVASNTASGAAGYIYVASGTNSAVSIGGTATLTNSGGSTTKRFYLGSSGDVTVTGDLDITNSASASNSQFYLNYSGNSANVYNGNITIEETNASSDGVYFGSNGGSATLASGRNFSIGAGGFVAGDLYIRNMTQLGSTASLLTLTGTGRYYPYDATFGGNMTVTAPRYYGRGTTYSGDFSLTYTGTSSSTSYGSNTFNGSAAYSLTGSGLLRLANNVANDYNGNVSLTRTAGTLQPAYGQSCTFAGNITVDANTEVTLGAGNGTVVFDGTGAQALNDGGTTSNFTFRRFTLNKASGEFTLNEPLRIQTTATFTSGVMNTDATNLLIFEDNSTVSGASDASFVDGPVDKIGNNVFEFPVGDSGRYRPISITAPSSNSAQFRGQYTALDPVDTYGSSYSGGIDHISVEEYWNLDRIASTNSVTVTIGWDANSGGVDNLSELVVARWDGGTWQNEGNGGTTGNTTAGTISTSGAVTSFSPFTLGSTTSNNPLPVDLVEFKATANETEKVVDLFWVTSSEINNDYFTVERTKDLKEFEEVLQVTGQGTTNERTEYHERDEQPLEGISYYRLSQTDFDGKVEHFDVEQVMFDLAQSVGIQIELYPNPNSGQTMFMKIPNANSEELKVLVNDFIGKEFLVDFTVIDQGDHSVVAIEMNEQLAAGSYMVNIKVGDEVHSHKLIVQ
ncbi:MAG: hypothetical protein CL840_18560 [Crocinitomicaceae bacterium]|nr:hypothetical protein [Crocinitomicaceae bacterium]|tara:strand:- start:3639 stop:11534 length:7896 start_codon:yes stop_codon:yes gene_type:complete